MQQQTQERKSRVSERKRKKEASSAKATKKLPQNKPQHTKHTRRFFFIAVVSIKKNKTSPITHPSIHHKGSTKHTHS
jgi:hypothetical protein